jgi:hypothetical protein
MKRVAATVGASALARPRLFENAGSMVRAALRMVPPALARRLAGAWGRGRAVPRPPQQSFPGRRVSELDAVESGDASPHSFADTEVFVCEAVIAVAETVPSGCRSLDCDIGLPCSWPST